jgi:hypothetical protein
MSCTPDLLHLQQGKYEKRTRAATIGENSLQEWWIRITDSIGILKGPGERQMIQAAQLRTTNKRCFRITPHIHPKPSQSPNRHCHRSCPFDDYTKRLSLYKTGSYTTIFVSFFFVSSALIWSNRPIKSSSVTC